jgi:hypothetical protein
LAQRRNEVTTQPNAKAVKSGKQESRKRQPFRHFLVFWLPYRGEDASDKEGRKPGRARFSPFPAFLVSLDGLFRIPLNRCKATFASGIRIVGDASLKPQ